MININRYLKILQFLIQNIENLERNVTLKRNKT